MDKTPTKGRKRNQYQFSGTAKQKELKKLIIRIMSKKKRAK